MRRLDIAIIILATLIMAIIWIFTVFLIDKHFEGHEIWLSLMM